MSTSSTSSTPTTAATGRLAPEQRSGGVYGSARPPTQRTDSPAPGAVLSATGEPTRDLVLLSLAELRTVRRTALRDEGDLSYVRRILQGRLDILRAEAATRRAERTPAPGSDSGSEAAQAGSPHPAGATGAGEGTVSRSGSSPVPGLALGFGSGLTGAGRRLVVGAPVVARLSQILADAPTRHRASARHVTVSVPQGEEYRRLAAEMLSEVELSDLSALTDEELENATARLGRYELQVSRRRGQLQRTADACGAEITRRYREGEAQVDDLLA
ncbi:MULTISPECIES: ABC transporter permease [Streptomyces]|uniref:ABC transporter permease n=1 Tax=Streptomyces odorifer TaxID=53450 RepID=A0A7Y6CCV4_9ACTN|nr:MULTISPECIES: ABC transporter permease [Streptomyces]NUV37485.1 ABC transporter permease [Streptomyces sp. KAI-27]NUV50949.1 ABC transporter permease [Streptomyces sp. CAI-78]MCK2142012.1 ABC transporter permease [Streptomyces sp. WAC00276]MCR0988468.1 ABC transporter permease [Streptomyces albidoflavus]NUV31010.1 ABC transporter permease [Streptomyces odorifer]